MLILPCLIFQFLASGLPADVLDAFNRINLTGGVAGSARVKAVRTTPDNPEPVRTFFMKAPNGDALTITEGTVEGEPRLATRVMQRGGYVVQSLSVFPGFQSANPQPPPNPKCLSYLIGPAADAALPRLTMNLSGPLTESDIIAAERLSAEGERFEKYRIRTNLFLDAQRHLPGSIVVTFDSANRRIVQTMTSSSPSGQGPVFDLKYGANGALIEIERKMDGVTADGTWKLEELDLGPSATPPELPWDLIGMSPGAQVIGPRPGEAISAGHGFWSGDTIIPPAEWVDSGERLDPRVLMQMEQRGQDLTYEFGEMLVLTELERIRAGADNLTPWHALVLQVARRASFSDSEMDRAKQILATAKERLRKVARRYSDDRKSEARSNMLEARSMHPHIDGRKDQKADDEEELKRARALFEDFWKELRKVKLAELGDLDRQFGIEAK